MLILGLGSNIGEREENLNKAINRLSEFLTLKEKSNIYESEALLKDEAPKEWNKPFLNMACSFINKNKLNFLQILERIKTIEEIMGRDLKSNNIWAPRVIDIDILCDGDIIFKNEILQIPHKEILNRAFVIKPLIDINPNWRHPIAKKSLSDVLSINENSNQYLTTIIYKKQI